jgi:hypothetical protein
MSDFVVRIDTAKLNEKQAAAIAGAIQGVVLSALGKLDLAHGHGASPVGVFGSILFHPEWRGLWLRDLKGLQDVKQPVLTVQQR